MSHHLTINRAQMPVVSGSGNMLSPVNLTGVLALVCIVMLWKTIVTVVIALAIVSYLQKKGGDTTK